MQKKLMKTVSTIVLSGILLLQVITPAMATNQKQTLLTGNGKEVKNVILLISDGWGENQILATNYFVDGKAKSQDYQKFPTSLYMSTYSYGDMTTADDQDSKYTPDLWSNFNLFKLNPTDSAAAGTAMSTGTKTYDAAIGVDQELENLKHIAEDFEATGKSTGVVSSVQISHATPASFVDHNASRNNYSEIANGMIQNSATDVIMGAGHPLYTDNGTLAATPNYRYIGGADTWNSLMNGTLGNDADQDGTIDYWTLLQSKTEFENLMEGNTPDRVIGIAQAITTLQQSRSGDRNADAYEVPFNANVPTLATMTKGALNVLDNNEEGFFLMVEGGAVDWAGHANQSGRLIEEQEDFNQAVEAVCAWVEENSSWSETLVIVTGDHETGYLTGTKGVYDEVINQGKGVMPVMSWNSGDHTNQLIPFFAKGAGAEIFKKLADEKDPIRGYYLDNTEISAAIRALID